MYELYNLHKKHNERIGGDIFLPLFNITEKLKNETMKNTIVPVEDNSINKTEDNTKIEENYALGAIPKRNRKKKNNTEFETPVNTNPGSSRKPVSSIKERENALKDIAYRTRYNLRQRNIEDSDFHSNIEREVENDINFCAIEGVDLTNRYQLLENQENPNDAEQDSECLISANQEARKEPMVESPASVDSSHSQQTEDNPAHSEIGQNTGDEASVVESLAPQKRKRYRRSRRQEEQINIESPIREENNELESIHTNNSTSSSDDSESEEDNTRHMNPYVKPPPFIIADFKMDPEEFKKI